MTEERSEEVREERIEKVTNWTDEETYKLIEIWSRDANQAELDSCRRNRDIYSNIAREMEVIGYSKTAEQCSRKMKKLRFEYRKGKLRGRHGKSGEKRYWKFFDAMDSVLGHKMVANPQAVPELNNVSSFSEDPREIRAQEGAALGEDRVERFEGDFITLETLDLESGEVSRNYPVIPSIAAIPSILPVEGRMRKRRRENDTDASDITEFLLDRMMKMQEGSDRHHMNLADKQMEIEARTQKENQEFQLRLMSILCNSRLPFNAHQSLSIDPPSDDRYNKYLHG